MNKCFKCGQSIPPSDPTIYVRPFPIWEESQSCCTICAIVGHFFPAGKEITPESVEPFIRLFQRLGRTAATQIGERGRQDLAIIIHAAMCQADPHLAEAVTKSKTPPPVPAQS